MTEKEFLIKMGIEITVARIRKGLVLTEVSKITGMPQGNLSRMETGKLSVRVSTLKILADCYGVPVKDFFTFVE